MKIYADWTVYFDRGDQDDWPDLWSRHHMRFMRPHKLTLAFRQRDGEDVVRLVRASAVCQKRWKNSRRLTSTHTWFIVRIWEIDGSVPDWLGPYIWEASRRIEPVGP